MDNLIYRTAKKADSREIASLISMAGGGIVEFLLHDLIPGVTPLQMMQNRVEDETSEFYFAHSTVASQNGDILGISHSFSFALKHKPEPGFIPQDRIDHVSGLYDTKLPESLYLLAFAVKSEARRRGIGTHLLELLKEKARKNGFSTVTLHVWKDNENAIRVYEKSGFRTIATIPIERDELLPHDGGLLLMSCDVNYQSGK